MYGGSVCHEKRTGQFQEEIHDQRTAFAAQEPTVIERQEQQAAALMTLKSRIASANYQIILALADIY